ncbi:MAG: NAD(P)-dependent oxidoreductase [Saprospiraceae bacterium]|nr:NAD(P)-dependent oxidoreductase [Saprospiraceae bacterium]
MENRKIMLIDEPHVFLEERLIESGFELLRFYKATKEEIWQILPECFGVVMRSRFKVDKTFLDRGMNLKFIAREGVGLDHIDVEYAEKKGIQVLYSPEGSRDTVAEHALGMLLMLLNKLSVADRQVREGVWKREPNRGIEIKGKTVGIIGYGNMGSALAQRLKGFEANVIAYDKFKFGYADENATEVKLETIFEESDIISFHIPYSTDNHHFVNSEFLNRFQKNIFLVNTARGMILNTADLVDHLKSGKVRGAALDVLEYEETSFNYLDFKNLPEPFQYLVNADNVVLSPHIAGWSVESKFGHAKVLAEKIVKRFEF